MKKTFRILLFSFVAAFLFGSCNNLINKPLVRPTYDRTSGEPASTGIYPTADPTFIAGFLGPEENNSGILTLVIEDVTGGCHEVGEAIQVKITLHNLTDEPLMIPGIFHISTNSIFYNDVIALFWPAGGGLYPFITVPLASSTFPTPEGYFELPGRGSLEQVVEYYIPQEISLFPEEEFHYLLHDVSSGNYYLKFEYRLLQFASDNILVEILEDTISNRIELCIIEL